MDFVVFVLSALTALAVAWMIYDWCREKAEAIELPVLSKPFSTAEYLERMERAQLDILEEQKPVDQTVILWWGLDGLTLDENGNLKWISRKKPEPINQNVFYQPCQSVLYANNIPVEYSGMCQSTQAKIDALRTQNAALQMQAAQQAQLAAAMAQVQTCCTPWPVPNQFSPYRSCYYGL